jgi:hypothetical protein
MEGFFVKGFFVENLLNVVLDSSPFSLTNNNCLLCINLPITIFLLI